MKNSMIWSFKGREAYDFNYSKEIIAHLKQKSWAFSKYKSEAVVYYQETSGLSKEGTDTVSSSTPLQTWYVLEGRYTVEVHFDLSPPHKIGWWARTTSNSKKTPA